MKIDCSRWRQTASLQIQLFVSHLSVVLLAAVLLFLGSRLYKTSFGEVVELGVVGVASLVFMSASTGRIIVQPLKKLDKAMQSFASGELQVRTTAGTTPELRRLSSSFNYLAASLQGVEERRQELIDDLLHDIRTPLSTIHANLKLLEKHQADQIGEPLSWMLQETQQLQCLAEDAYRASLVEDGYLPIRFQNCRIEPILKDCARCASIQSEAHQIQLEYPTQLPSVYADPDRVKQILLNLLNNAIAYTPQGSIKIRAWAEANCLWVAVTDTGVGIASEDIPYVFERSWRSKWSQQVVPNGRGIGLSVTKRLVELQSGQIEVESILGKGSTFRFSLQLA